MQLLLKNETATLNFGAALAAHLVPGTLLFLHGDLGAGKTTLVRGILHGLGHSDAVKSPTYTIVEPYEFNDFTLYHLDLYRIADPEELHLLGMDDFLSEKNITIIEWPQQGGKDLPLPDLQMYIEYAPESGREITCQPHSPRGDTILASLKENL